MEHERTEPAGTEGIPLYCETVALRIAGDQLGSFFPLLQRGVTVQAVVGCPLRELLTTQLGIPADYVAGRITTIFLDNKPVDDLDCTKSRTGDPQAQALQPAASGTSAAGPRPRHPCET